MVCLVCHKKQIALSKTHSGEFCGGNAAISAKVGRGAGPGLQIRCAPGARATCSAVLFGVLDHCRRPVRSAGILGGSSWQKNFMR